MYIRWYCKIFIKIIVIIKLVCESYHMSILLWNIFTIRTIKSFINLYSLLYQCNNYKPNFFLLCED